MEFCLLPSMNHCETLSPTDDAEALEGSSVIQASKISNNAGYPRACATLLHYFLRATHSRINLA